jgi:hypothetical protein
LKLYDFGDRLGLGLKDTDWIADSANGWLAGQVVGNTYGRFSHLLQPPNYAPSIGGSASHLSSWQFPIWKNKFDMFDMSSRFSHLKSFDVAVKGGIVYNSDEWKSHRDGFGYIGHYSSIDWNKLIVGPEVKVQLMWDFGRNRYVELEATYQHLFGPYESYGRSTERITGSVKAGWRW